MNSFFLPYVIKKISESKDFYVKTSCKVTEDLLTNSSGKGTEVQSYNTLYNLLLCPFATLCFCFFVPLLLVFND
jgi:hypothetical protein